MELKYNKSAQEALAQIDSKGYLLPYKADGHKLYHPSRRPRHAVVILVNSPHSPIALCSQRYGGLQWGLDGFISFRALELIYCLLFEGYTWGHRERVGHANVHVRPIFRKI